MNNEKKPLYVPSFTVGPLGNALEKNAKLPDNSTLRFWDPDFEKKYQHKTMLLTAGHKYKDMEYSKKFNFPDDMVIFGDSGGYQIVSDVLKYTPELKERIFDWLQENSTIAMNLDIPVRGNIGWDECLEISLINYKYFEKNQTGKVDYLNVLHGGESVELFNTWYNAVSGFDFNGWALGGTTSWKRIIMALTTIFAGGEHLKPNNKYVHILGRSRVSDIFLICRLQHMLNSVGSNMMVTADSSTPSISTAFGNFFYGFDVANDTFKMLTYPRASGNSKNPLAPLDVTNADCLVTNEYSERLFRNYTAADIGSFKSEHYAAMAVQNLTIFLDAFEFCEKLARSDEYFIREIIGNEKFQFMKILDQIVTDENPMRVYRKNEPKLDLFSRNLTEVKYDNINMFF